MECSLSARLTESLASRLDDPSPACQPEIVTAESKSQADLRVAHLTRAISSGDDEAFELFYDDYYDRLYRYLMVMVRGDEERALDCLQAVLLRVVKYLNPFDCEDGLWRWLTRLCRSAVIDSWRRSRGQTHLGDPSEAIADPTFSHETDADRRLIEMLDLGMGRLRAEDRQLIQRTYLDGDERVQIAADAGLTYKGLESRLARIRKKLKTMIIQFLNHED